MRAARIRSKRKSRPSRRSRRVRRGGKFEVSRPVHSLRKGSFKRLGKRLSGKTKYDYNHNLKQAWEARQKAESQLARDYLHKFSPAGPQRTPWYLRPLGVQTADEADERIAEYEADIQAQARGGE